ncbi:hypothetical protein [Streptomyces liangshanensis]|uniref:Uncharacterized protein n=1 Tax=Streptomyces liangshanensis TaxID=2717324 RepID=A0A6G9GS48_9ACTN|nr:hypothetical protein [Streptomyces liangshanensis]QIQ00899.1 hypothetical protein HA039_33490 [Streptomyces liangshanensis]
MSYPHPLTPEAEEFTPEERLAEAKKQLNLPRIVAICGSTRFMTEMTEADLRETGSVHFQQQRLFARFGRRWVTRATEDMHEK